MSLKLSTKMYGGFGIILVLLLILSAVVYGKLRSISGRSEQSLQFGHYETLMVEREVDHLKWIRTLESLFLNNLDKVELQLDPTQCGLGKFMYGEEGARLAKADPQAAALIEEVKEPHRHLHESAKGVLQEWGNQKADKAKELLQSDTYPALARTQAKLKDLKTHLQAQSDGAGNTLQKEVTAEVAKNLGGIREAAGKVATLIAEIAAASKEQTQGIDQINTAVSEMDKVVQHNAANAEESASASEELSSQAQELNAMVEALMTIVGRTGEQPERQVRARSERTKAVVSKPYMPVKKVSASCRLASSKHSKPEEVIPLEEQEFKDF